MARRLLIPAAALLLGLIALRLVAAALLPIVEDEAYYVLWGRTPDTGYYDHPPFVAWIAMTERLAPGSPLAARIGSMAIAALAFPFLLGLFARCGLGRRGTIAALLLATCNVYALAIGVLVLPDAVMFTAWCIGLHEAAAALQGRRARWVTAGIAVGAGLLSKYIMVLIGLVFLWALIRSRPRDLRRPWPWLGVAAALLVFSPHLAWNARNDWTPIRMQFVHGFTGADLDDLVLASPLPQSRHPEPGRPERRIGDWFRPPAAPVAATIPPPRPHAHATMSIVRPLEYMLAVFVMWGAFSVPIVTVLIHTVRGRPYHEHVDRSLRPLMHAATWIPLGFFGLVSVMSGVEGNWPAVYTVSASALLAGWFSSRLRSAQICAAINAIGILAVAIYARTDFTPWSPDRVRVETRGWPALAAHVAQLDGPILGDGHQLLGQLMFHEPDLAAAQWPGMTRPSEFVRRPEWSPWTPDDLRAAGGFHLVTTHSWPPVMDGFTAESSTEIVDCLDDGLMFTEAFSAETYEPPCADDRIVHRWFLTRYRVAAQP